MCKRIEAGELLSNEVVAIWAAARCEQSSALNQAEEIYERGVSAAEDEIEAIRALVNSSS